MNDITFTLPNNTTFVINCHSKSAGGCCNKCQMKKINLNTKDHKND